MSAINENIKCYLCNSPKYKIIHKGVRGNEDIDVLKCLECGLVRLSKFIDNTDQFYQESKMRNITDLEIKKVLVTASSDDERRYNFTKRIIENKSVLDFGCGAGGYLNRILPITSVCEGVELENLMRDSLNEKGIKCYPSINSLESESNKKYDVITLWHVLEHLSDPIDILARLGKLLKQNGKIIIEVPNADDALISQYNCRSFEDFTYWECHFYLYTVETLRQVIQKAGLHCQFIKQIQRYSLSNHLYWLSEGKPGGHVEWSMLSDDKLDKEYERVLSSLGTADTIVAEISVD